MLCTFHYLLQLGAPRSAIPDLDAPAHADHDDLTAEPRVLEEARRHHYAALLVRLCLDGAGVVEAFQLAALSAERVEPCELLLHETRPVREWVGLHAGVEPSGENDTVRHRRPKPRRQSEAVLVVQGVFEFSE